MEEEDLGALLQTEMEQPPEFFWLSDAERDLLRVGDYVRSWAQMTALTKLRGYEEHYSPRDQHPRRGAEVSNQVQQLPAQPHYVADETSTLVADSSFMDGRILSRTGLESGTSSWTQQKPSFAASYPNQRERVRTMPSPQHAQTPAREQLHSDSMSCCCSPQACTGCLVFNRYLRLLREDRRVYGEETNIPILPGDGGGSTTYPQSLESARKKRKKPVPWTAEEHGGFLRGLEKHGRGAWRKISAEFVPTRTAQQITTHAQNYFKRQKTASHAPLEHGMATRFPK